MARIKTLSPDVVASIAAGEVVERPASVVKELIENALDAQARFIEVVIEESGMKKIQVTDDGVGMDSQDIQACFKPHATSKISRADDLLALSTLGFRGEALSSIAASSELTIASRPQSTRGSDGSGMHVHIVGGTLMERKPLGMPAGTHITITDLFADVPARKQFLKHPRTEWAHILRSVTAHALAAPQVGFKLIHNGKTIFTLSPETQEERIAHVLGSDMVEHSLALKSDTISGWVVTPQQAARRREKGYVFINNRPITHKGIARSIKQAYGTLLPQASEPFFVVFLTVPPDRLDINIHPRKETIRLVHEEDVLRDISTAVQEALGTSNLTYTLEDKPLTLRERSRARYGASFLRENTPVWDPRASIPADGEIIQIHNLYLIAPTQDGVMIIDQHAAHERILYEAFLETLNTAQAQPRSHALSKPVDISLPITAEPMLKERLEQLTQLGFALTLKGTVLTITAVPEHCAGQDISTLILSVITADEETPVSAQHDPHVHRHLATLACKSAIKQGDPLTPAQRRALVEKLHKTKGNYTCPHGRPVTITLSLEELHRMFGR